MVSFSFEYNLELDLKNWFDGCNSCNYGNNWISNLPNKNLINFGNSLKGKKYEEIYDNLKEFVIKYYEDNFDEINDVLFFGKKFLDENFGLWCNNLEQMIGHKICFNKYTIYLTTFPRGPYNSEKFFSLFYYKRNIKSLSNHILHEGQHLMLTKYFCNHDCLKNLSKQQFNDLKESLTVILNDFSRNLIFGDDLGYQNHQGLREKIFEYWKGCHNFEKTLIFGAENINLVE